MMFEEATLVIEIEGEENKYIPLENVEIEKDYSNLSQTVVGEEEIQIRGEKNE